MENQVYVAMDKESLALLINAYAELFYAKMDGRAHIAAGDKDVRHIVKKLAQFVEEYESLLKKEEEAKKPAKKPEGEAITRKVG